MRAALLKSSLRQSEAGSPVYSLCGVNWPEWPAMVNIGRSGASLASKGASTTGRAKTTDPINISEGVFILSTYRER